MDSGDTIDSVLEPIDTMQEPRAFKHIDIEDEHDLIHIQDGNELSMDYHSGYLWKQSSNFKNKWQKRWFVIYQGELQYFRDSDQAYDFFTNQTLMECKSRKEYLGNVARCRVSKIVYEKHKYVLSVTTSLQRTYLLKAMNSAEYDKWFSFLSSPASIPSNLPSLPSEVQSVCMDSVKRKPVTDHQQQKLVESYKRRCDVGEYDPVEYRGDIGETHQLIQQIYASNKYCADCNACSPEWVSINIGVVICYDCCSVHRDMGCHISKVRSLMLDDLHVDVLRYIVQIGGNSKLNQLLLEETLSKSEKISYKSCSLVERSDFIHAKYAKKLFVNTLHSEDLLDMNEYLYDAVIHNDCFGIIFALFHGATVDGRYKRHNDKTVLHEAILRNHSEAVQLLLQNDATPILQI